jgi:hypothetical protein
VELVGTVINATVVALVGAILAWLAKGRFDAVDQRFDRLEHRVDRFEERLDGRIDRLGGRIDRVGSALDALRSDITPIALAVGVRPKARND